MAKSYSVTSAGVNPTEDRAHRMRMYFIAMTLRVACVVSLFWVRGWWVLAVAAGAVLLPWFAVLVGNAVAHGGEETPEAPDPLQIMTAEAAASEEPASSTLLVVDVDPERRASSTAAPGSSDLGSGAGPSTPSGAFDPSDPADPSVPPGPEGLR